MTRYEIEIRQPVEVAALAAIGWPPGARVEPSGDDEDHILIYWWRRDDDADEVES